MASGAVIGALRAELSADSAAWEQDMGRAGGALSRLQKQVLGVTAVLGTAGAVAYSWLKAQGEAEAGINKLNLALANQGKFSEATSRGLREMAASMQQTTTYSDDAVIAAQTQLAAYGMTEEQIRTTTAAAADLAAFLGIDLASAAEMLGKAFTGNTTALQKMGFQFDDGASKGQKFDSAIAQVQQRFGGAAAQAANTFEGSLEQVKNAYGEVEEAGGKLLGQLFDMGSGVNVVKQGFELLADFVGDVLVRALGEARAMFSETVATFLEHNARMAHAMADLAEMAGFDSKAKEVREEAQALEDYATALQTGANAWRETSDAAADGEQNITKVTNATVKKTSADVDAVKAAKEHAEWLKKVAAGMKANFDAISAKREKRESYFDDLGKGAEMAQAEMIGLTSKVEEYGGVSALSAQQTEALVQQLFGLYKAGAEIPQDLGKVTDELNRLALEDATKPFDDVKDGIEDLQKTVLRMAGFGSDAIAAIFGEVPQAAEGATVATVRWTDALGNLTNMLQATGTAGSLVAKIIGNVAGVGSLFDPGAIFGGDKDGIGKGFVNPLKQGLGSAIKSIGGYLQIGLAALDVGKMIAGLFSKSPAEKAMEQVGKRWGQKITDSLAEEIGKDAKRLGDDVAASLLHVDDVISEAGGVEAFGIEKATAAARDLFVMIETGKLSVDEAGDTFNSVFGELADNLVKTGQLASEQFLELMKLDSQFGTQSQAVKDFLGSRVQDLDKNLQTIIAGGIETAAGAEAIGTSFFAAYQKGIESGMSGWDAIQAILPSIEAFEEELKKTGYSGGAAFEQIRGMAALAGDEVAGPLLEKIHASVGALVALQQMGVLTQDTFMGLTTEIGATYDKLLEQGKSGPAALRLMQPDLQKIWEMQHRYGYAVDESTQKLLDEAEAANLVGEAHMSTEEKMLDGVERIADAVEGLASVFGILPKAAQDAANGMNRAFAGVKVPDGSGGYAGGPAGKGVAEGEHDPNVPGFASGSGGFRNFGRGTLVELHGTEAVVRPQDIASLVGGGTRTSNQFSPIINAVPGEDPLATATKGLDGFIQWLRDNRGGLVTEMAAALAGRV